MAITKTFVLVDESSLFPNPALYEEDGQVNSVVASQLTPDTRYYTRGGVISDGTTVYSGNIKSFVTPEYLNNFYIKNLYNGSNTVTLTKTGSPAGEGYLQYSLDNSTWTTVDFNGGTTWTQTLNNQNDKLYLRSSNGVSSSSSNYITITANQNHAAGGQLKNLVDYTSSSEPSLSSCGFYRLFMSNVNITDVSELDFSATTLANYCYQSMFYGCTSLTTAPELPATTLAAACYQSMFGHCTSLTAAPELPATTLAGACYFEMFSGCTSLTTAPELPATTLVTQCYDSMFSGCTSLTTAPELPATTLTDWCYQQMFSGCTSLTTAPELPATTLVSNCYYQMFSGCTSLSSITTYATSWVSSRASNWVAGVASSGSFFNLGSATIPTGTNGIPSGWTEYNQI